MKRFELKNLTEYSNDAILEELRRVAALHSVGALTKTAYHGLSPKVSANTIRRRFGSWRKALEAAGLSMLYVESHMPYRARVQRAVVMSDADLLAELRRVHAAVGTEALTKTDFNRHSVTHYDAVRQRFGTWKNALERAGIAQSALAKRYTDQKCYENIVILWTHYGRQPLYRELKEPPSTVGPKAYIQRWGAWRKTLKAFVEWANAEDHEPSGMNSEPQSASCEEPPRNKLKRRLRQQDLREIPLKLRFKVFQRDRFRCVACGRSPANDLTVELHVDHILPWADEGETTLENLQTLCEECNLGKGRSFAKVGSSD